MKTDIKREGIWWSWVEYCDKCGKLVFTHNTKTTTEPNREEVDFCYFCLLEFFDNNIPYKEMKEKYRRKNEN